MPWFHWKNEWPPNLPDLNPLITDYRPITWGAACYQKCQNWPTLRSWRLPCYLYGMIRHRSSLIQKWKWVIFRDPWPMWPITQLTNYLHDPWPWTLHHFIISLYAWDYRRRRGMVVLDNPLSVFRAKKMIIGLIEWVSISQRQLRTKKCKLLRSYFIIIGQWITGSDPWHTWPIQNGDPFDPWPTDPLTHFHIRLSSHFERDFDHVLLQLMDKWKLITSALA